MRKHKTARGFVLGFLVCALLTCGVSYADDIYENIEVLMGKMHIYFGDTPIEVDNMVYNGTTYVPLRSYSEQLGLVVDYDAATDKVTVKNKSEAQLMSKEIAFLVNGQPVRVDFFTQMVNWYLMNSAPGTMTSEAYADFKDFVREEVVGMEVTEQYTESLGITLSGTDLNAINNKIEIYANNFGGMDAFVELLRQNGVSYETYYEIQKNYMLREKLTDIMSDSITEDEISAYYDAYKDTYYKKEKVTAKQILMSTVDDAGYALSPSVKAEKKAQMLDIYDDIINGAAEFDDMMFTYSEDVFFGQIDVFYKSVAAAVGGFVVAQNLLGETFHRLRFHPQQDGSPQIFLLVVYKTGDACAEWRFERHALNAVDKASDCHKV